MNDTEKTKKETARQAMLRILGNARTPLAIHEMEGIKDHSQNAMATEISRMAKDGLVKGEIRAGKKFKEWALVLTPSKTL